MDVKLYNVIIRPLLTEKAYRMNQKLRKLVLKIHPSANKSQVKQALKTIFDVDVKSVNIQVKKGKSRRVAKKIIWRPGSKRAIVTLKEGSSFGAFENMAQDISSVGRSEE